MPSCLARVLADRWPVRHQDAPVAVPAARAPHLLAVHDVPLTVEFRPGASATPRSLPAPGSENSWHHTCSVASVAREVGGLLLGRAEPLDRSPRPARSPTMLRNGGTPARAHSSNQTPLCSAVRPMPPCSTGQWMPGVAGLVDAVLPGEPGIDQVGRADRAVVARGARAVLGQPGRHLELEVVDGDHPAKVRRPRTPHAQRTRPPGVAGPVTSGGAPRGSTTARRGRAATGRRPGAGRTATGRTAGRGGCTPTSTNRAPACGTCASSRRRSRPLVDVSSTRSSSVRRISRKSQSVSRTGSRNRSRTTWWYSATDHLAVPRVAAARSSSPARCRCRPHGVDAADELGRVVLGVAVGVEDPRPGGRGEPRDQRAAVAAVRLVAHDAQLGDLAGERLEHRHRPVGRSVVDDDDLEVVDRCGERRCGRRGPSSGSTSSSL